MDGIEKVLAIAETARFVDIAPDYYDWYIQDYLAQENKGSTMPPTPLCKSASYDYAMERDSDGEWELHVTGELSLTEWALSLIERFGFDDHICHRSRICSIASGMLRYKELARRVSRREKYQHVLSELCAKYNPLFSEIVHIRTEAVEKYTGISQIPGYITEHKTSSIVPGVKWGMLEPNAVAELLYPRVLEMVLSMPSHSGKYINVPMYNGMRTRAATLADSKFEMASNKVRFSGIMPRTRIVNFFPTLSLGNLVLENKADYYKDNIHWAKDVLKIESPIMTPLIDGGSIYKTARDKIASGSSYVAVDGKNHESNVCEILGPPTYPWATTVKGQRHEPSGVDTTSLYNTDASLSYIREFEFEVGPFELVILMGDDIDIIGTEQQIAALTKNYLFRAGLVEVDEKDTKLQYMLGVVVTPDKSGLNGLKLSHDRADKMIGLNDLVHGHDERVRRIDIQAANFIYDAWPGVDSNGRIGGREILDVMAGLQPDEFQGVGVAIEKLILSGGKPNGRGSEEDPKD